MIKIMFRALFLYNPTVEMSGEYTCKVKFERKK